MAPLSLFVVLLLVALFAGRRLNMHVVRLRRIGMGSPHEDLDKARRNMRSTVITMMVLVVVIAAVIWLGERWAYQWREVLQGRAVLIILFAVSGAGWLWATGYALFQQWSAQGSWRGLAAGVLYVGLATLALMISGRWLLG